MTSVTADLDSGLDDAAERGQDPLGIASSCDGQRLVPGAPSHHGGRWIARAGLPLVLVAMAVGAVLMIPRLHTVRIALGHVRRAQPGWLAAGVVATLALSLVSSLGTRAAVGRRFPWHQLVEVELAATAANRLAPIGVGGVGVKSVYLCRHGVAPAEAGAALAMVGVVGATIHGTCLAVTTAMSGGPVNAPLPVLVGAGSGLMVLAVATMIARPGGRVRRVLESAVGTIRAILSDPRRLGVMAASSAGVTTLNVLALGFACQAIGVRTSWWEIASIYLAGRAVGAAAPTPNGLGATEAALLAGFTTAGVLSAPALAVVLVYRLVTFWMPILPGLIGARRVRHRLSLLPA